MGNMDDYFNALEKETLLEMAENFFGERSSLDEEKERFALKVQHLNDQVSLVLEKAALLHMVLLDRENVKTLYAMLDVSADKLLLWTEQVEPQRHFPVPHALFAKNRYIKLVLHVYEIVQQAIDEYMNGRLHTPRGSSRKLVSINYKMLMDWSEQINERIRKVNEGLTPSSVLGFAHCMNVCEMEKERISGATLQNFCTSLDQGLKIEPVDCEKYALKKLPELPPVKQAKDTITTFAGKLYAGHPTEIRQLMTSLAHRTRT